MTWERVNRFLIEKVMVMMMMVMMMMRRRRRPRKREDATRVGANEPRRRVNGVGQRLDENLRSSGRPPNDRPVAVVFRDAKHSAAERSCQSVDPSRCLSLRLRRPTRRRRRPFCFRFCFFCCCCCHVSMSLFSTPISISRVFFSHYCERSYRFLFCKFTSFSGAFFSKL